MEKNIDVNKVENHWIESAEKDFVTMNHLFDSKDYSWSLFMGHIVLEKVLKARVRIEPHPFIYEDFNLNNPVVDEILKYGINLNVA